MQYQSIGYTILDHSDSTKTITKILKAIVAQHHMH